MADVLILPTSFGMLRLWRLEDAEALAGYANNRKVWLNLRDGFPHPYTLEHAHAFLERMQAQEPKTFFALATPKEAIGGIGVSLNADIHRQTAELGYWLAEPYWGRGIMSEAVRCFTDFAFRRFELLRIYAEPFVHNAGSIRVLEKAGFTLEGRLRANAIKDGQIVDMLMFARLNLPEPAGAA